MTSASHFIAAEGGATGSSPFCTYSMGSRYAQMVVGSAKEYRSAVLFPNV